MVIFAWVNVKIEEAPTCLPTGGKIKDTKEVSLLFGSSHTRLGLLKLVFISSMYLYQKLRDSSAK